MRLKEIEETVDSDQELLIIIEGDDGMDGSIWLTYKQVAAMVSAFGYRMCSDLED